MRDGREDRVWRERVRPGRASMAMLGAGDYSDVTVVDAAGRRIPWPEVSHLGDGAMGDLMRQIVDRVYTFNVMAGDADFQAVMERWVSVARGWDAPKLDAGFMRAIEAHRAGGDDMNADGVEKWSPIFGQRCKVEFAPMRGPYCDGETTQFFT